MKPIRIDYCISLIDKSLGFEWLAKYLDRAQFDANFILYQQGESQLSGYLRKAGYSVTIIPYRTKQDLPAAFFKTFFLWLKKRPQIVHCHLFEASVIGILVSWVLQIPKRIYTRHHGTLHHQYHPHAVRYDKIINSLSTKIVAISASVQEILTDREQVPAHKVTIVPHGFELETFSQIDTSKIQYLREKYQLTVQNPIIGVISRFTHWKGIQYIIPAFSKLLLDFPNAKLVLANAQGDYETEITQLLAALPAQSYVCIPFEPEVGSLYNCFDVFVHTPIDPYCEAFGQVYIEAMLAKIPMVVTLSGIALNLLNHQEHAWVVPYQDTTAVYEGIKAILEQPDLRNKLVENSYTLAIQQFKVQTMLERLEKLYLS